MQELDRGAQKRGRAVSSGKTLVVSCLISLGVFFSSPSLAAEDFNKTLKERPVGDFDATNNQQIRIIEEGISSHPYRSAPVDFDRTSEMILAWDKWHKEVASAIYERFNENAQANFRHSPPLKTQISYMVAKDGRIGNIRILEPSNNQIFNTMLVSVIKSMAHNPVLEYPAGSRRQFVEKSGTFTWNYSGGGSFPAAPLPKIGPAMVAK